MTYNCAKSVEEWTAKKVSSKQEENLKGTNPRNGRFRLILQLVRCIVLLVDSALR